MSAVAASAVTFKSPVKATSPAKVELLPLNVIGALPKVSESVTPLRPCHKATVCPVPTPDNTDELSTLCHVPPPRSSFHTTQSPTSQLSGSLPVPFGVAAPGSLQIK